VQRIKKASDIDLNIIHIHISILLSKCIMKFVIYNGNILLIYTYCFSILLLIIFLKSRYKISLM